MRDWKTPPQVSQISPEIKIPPADDEWKSHKLPRHVKRH